MTQAQPTLRPFKDTMFIWAAYEALSIDFHNQFGEWEETKSERALDSTSMYRDAGNLIEQMMSDGYAPSAVAPHLELVLINGMDAVDAHKLPGLYLV